jgi:hypothetical protein
LGQRTGRGSGPVIIVVATVCFLATVLVPVKK